MGAVLACGTGAVLAERSVAALLDSPGGPSAPPVLVARRHRPVKGVVIHHCVALDPRDARRTRDSGDDGRPDAARLGVRPTAHQLAGSSRDRVPWFDLAATRGRWAGQRASRDRDARAGARALRRRQRRTKSRYEDAFLASPSPEPLVNMELLGFEVDFHWPAWRLVVEVDGRHTRPRDLRDDPARDQVLHAAGWTRRALHRRARCEYLASSDERATPDRLLRARRP